MGVYVQWVSECGVWSVCVGEWVPMSLSVLVIMMQW